MKTFLNILKWIGISIALLVAIGFFLPGSVGLERSTVIKAPVEKVYGQVVDYKNWQNWSPWYGIDSTAQWNFAETTSGKGAYYTWKGETVGEGKLQMDSTIINKSIRNTLIFADMNPTPTNFMFEAIDSNQTKVTWDITADMGVNPVHRWFGFLMFKKFTGEDYEKGLAKLKTFCEK